MNSNQKTLQELASEIDRLYMMINSCPSLLWLKDCEYRYTFANQAFCRENGIKDLTDLYGKTDFDIITKDRASLRNEIEREVITKGISVSNHLETFLVDANKHWFSIDIFPIRDEQDGSIAGLFGIGRDISDFKQLEEQGKYEYIHMRALMENIPDAIFFKDEKSRFVRISRALAKKFGINNPSDAIGKTDADFFTEEHAQQALDDEQIIMDTIKPIVAKEEKETWYNRPDTWVSTTKMPLLDTKGRCVGTFGIARDVTEVHYYREALQKAKGELEVHVQERTAELQQANERLQIRNEQLHFLTESSYKLSLYVRMNELFPTIVNTFASRFPNCEASICTLKEGTPFCAFATRKLSWKREINWLETIFSALEQSELRTPLIIQDWGDNPRLAQSAPESLKQFPCFIVIPLLNDNRMVSCIQILTVKEHAELFEQEKPLLTTLGAHAAVCLRNAEYYLELEKNVRLEAELKAARSIQQSFTPTETPNIPHINLTGIYRPAFEVSGDYLDYFQTEKGYWVIVVADVCGKGIPAALLMTVLRSTFRAEAQNITSAKQLLCITNLRMKININERSFITALCLVINKEGTKMTYASAGHPLLIKLGANGNKPENIKAIGSAMGIESPQYSFDSSIGEVALDLHAGDRFIIYTDGLTEAFNPNKEIYGMKRLTSLLENVNSNNPKTIVREIIENVDQFTQNTPYYDDLTMLAMSVY